MPPNDFSDNPLGAFDDEVEINQEALVNRQKRLDQLSKRMNFPSNTPKERISAASSASTINVLNKLIGKEIRQNPVDEILNSASRTNTMRIGKGGDPISLTNDFPQGSFSRWRTRDAMSFSGLYAIDRSSEAMNLLENTLRSSGMNLRRETTHLGSREQGMDVNTLIATQKLGNRTYRTGFFTGSQGVNYFFNPENPNMAYPVLPQVSMGETGDVSWRNPLDRITGAAKSGPIRQVLSKQFRHDLGEEGTLGVSISRLRGQPGLEALYSQSLQGKMNEDLLGILNEGRGNNPFVQGVTGVAAPAQAYSTFRPTTQIGGEWYSAFDKIKRRKLETGDIDILRSRNDEIPYGTEPGFFEGQVAPNRGYNTRIFFDAFSPLPEGQGITSSLFAARKRRGVFSLPEGTQYNQEQDAYSLPGGETLKAGSFFGRQLGRLNSGNERVGGRGAFRNIFGSSMGSYQSVSVDALTPRFNAEGQFTGEVAGLFTQTTDQMSVKSGAIKAFMRRVNKSGMTIAEADAEMRLPGASALPRLGMQVLMAQYPTTEALSGWFSGVASAQGKSEQWISQNFRGGRFSSEAAPMVLQAGVENILNRLTPFQRRDQELDPQTYEALRSATFEKDGALQKVIPDTEGNVTPRYDEQGTAVGYNVKEMWGLGAVLPVSTNVRAEFNRSTMSISPSVLSVLSQYEPERFQSLMEIGQVTRGRNQSLNLVQSYRANYSENQLEALKSTFGVQALGREELAEMQQGIISSNPNMGGDTVSELMLRKLTSKYGNKALSIDDNGETTYLPSARAALSSLTKSRGQLLPGFGLKQSQLLQSYGGGEDISQQVAGLMGRPNAEGKYAQNTLGFMANSPTVLKKALSIEMPRLGGLGTAIGGIDPNTAVVSGRTLMSQLGIKKLDELRELSSSGALNAMLTRDPFSKIDEYAAGMNLALYEDQSEKFRRDNPDPGQGMYISPVAGSAGQGDFDADRYKLILNAIKNKGGMFLSSAAQSILPNSEMISRAKNKFESEWTKNVSEFAERSGQYGDINAFKSSFSDPKKLFPMLLSEMGHAFFKDQKSGSKGIGTTYNALLRNAFGAATITAETDFPDNEVQQKLAQSKSVLYHRAAQAALDAEKADPQMMFLRDVMTTGFMSKDRRFKYKTEKGFEDLGTEEGFGQRIFEATSLIGQDTTDEEYIGTGLSRGVATSLIGMQELATNPNPNELTGQMEDLLMRRRGGENVSREMLALTGAGNYREWMFGKEGDRASSLSLMAHSFAGRVGEWAMRSGKALGLRSTVLQAGEAFGKAKAYKNEVEKTLSGVESVAGAKGGSQAMRSYIQGLIPEDIGDREWQLQQRMNAATSVSAEVAFSNTINAEVEGEAPIPAGILGGRGGRGGQPPITLANPPPEEPGKPSSSMFGGASGTIRSGGTQIVKQSLFSVPKFGITAAGNVADALKNIDSLKERLNSTDPEVAKSALKQYRAIEQAAGYVSSVGAANKSFPERDPEGRTYAESTPSYRLFQQAVGDKAAQLFTTLDDTRGEALSAATTVAGGTQATKISSTARNLSAMPLSEFASIMTRAQTGDKEAISDVRSMHRSIRTLQKRGENIPQELEPFMGQIADIARSSSAGGSAAKVTDELKMSIANAAQGYLGKNMDKVPEILNNLAKAISGIGEASDETTKRAKNFVKAFKDSSDELELAITTRQAGGTLTPSQESLLGGDVGAAQTRLTSQRTAAAQIEGALYRAGIEDIPEAPQTRLQQVKSRGEAIYNRIIKGTGLFHARMATGIFISPAINAAEEYVQTQARQEISQYQSGQISYADMMSGNYGDMRRRQIAIQEGQLAYGRQVYEAYSPIINTVMSPEVTGSILGAAAGIGGPALGVGIAATSLTGSPLVGGIAAGATAAIGAVGYGVSNSYNNVAIGNFLNSRQNIVEGLIRNPEGVAGALGVGARKLFGTVSDEEWKQYQNAGEFTNLINTFGMNRQNMLDTGNRLGYSPTQTISANAEAWIRFQTGEGAPRDVATQNLQYWQTYNPRGTTPSGDVGLEMTKINIGGGDYANAALALARSRGISQYNIGAMGSINDEVRTDLANAAIPSLASQQMIESSQAVTQVADLQTLAGQVPLSGALYDKWQIQYGIPTANALLQNQAYGATLGLKNNDYYRGASRNLGQAAAYYRQGNGQAASVIEANTMTNEDIYTRLQGMGATGQELAGINRINSMTAPGQSGLYNSAIRGDRMSLSILGQRQNRPDWMTINPQTGMDIYYQNIPQANLDVMKSYDSYGLLNGSLTDRQLQLGTRGYQNEIRLEQRSQQNSQWFAGNMQRDVGFNMMTGNLAQVQQLMGNTNPNLPGYQGMGFNIGNGMGTWQLEDAQRLLGRTQQQFSYGQQTAALGISEKEFTLSGQQFNANWDLSNRRLNYDTQRQEQEMGIDRSHQVRQLEWQTEDLAYSRSQLDINFGWNMEDYTRNIRYARGREKRDLMREQGRAVIQYGMAVGQSERQSERLEEQKTWADEAYERQKEYFEQNKQFQREALDNQKFFFEKGREFDRQRLDLQQQEHIKQLGWMQEEWKLEDQRVLLDRQNQVYQYNMQVAIDQKVQQSTTNINNWSDALQLANDAGSQANAWLETLAGKLSVIAGLAINIVGGNDSGNGGTGGMPSNATKGTRWTDQTGKEWVWGDNGWEPYKSGGIGGGKTGAQPTYKRGGSTGIGSSDEVAGVVHRGEWVVPENGALVVRGSDPLMQRLVDLMEKSVKIQNDIAAKPSQFTAVLEGKATRAVPVSPIQTARSRIN